MKDIEILSLGLGFGKTFQDVEEIKKYLLKSIKEDFVFIKKDIDLDYFLSHLEKNLIGLVLNNGPYCLNGDGHIEEIKSPEDFQEGYDFAGAFYLEKDILLDYLETGNLPLEKCRGIALAKNKSGEKRPALFLDRDGVINVDKHYVASPDQVTFFEGIIPIIKFANDRNWPVIVLTNQSGVGRGLFSEEDLLKIHSFIEKEIENKGARIDDWFFCPYHFGGGVGEYKRFSFLRKPFPGMALKALEKHSIDINKSFIIGDKVTDEIYLPGLKCLHLQRDFDLSKAEAPILSSYGEIMEYLKSVTSI